MSNIVNSNPDNLIEYIEVKSNYFFVKKRINNKIVTFGKFNSIQEACAAANLLINNNWMLSNVSFNPLIKYKNNYFVFKLEENKVTTDKKFTSYESAVEYIEINQKSNDQNNDIFSKKRNRKKREFKVNNAEINTFEDKIIQEENNNFVIRNNVPSNNFQYGEFNSFEKAKVAKKLLLKYNWDCPLFNFNVDV